MYIIVLLLYFFINTGHKHRNKSGLIISHSMYHHKCVANHRYMNVVELSVLPNYNTIIKWKQQQKM